jgi:hypothetical protein
MVLKELKLIILLEMKVLETKLYIQLNNVKK